MAQRDYEEQPEAPDLGASVQPENSETLVGPGDGDGLDAGYVPPDRPYGLDEDGVTGSGMRDGDSLDDRLRREQGDEPVDPDRSGRIAIAGEGAAVDDPHADGAARIDAEREAGGAAAPASGRDDVGPGTGLP